MGRLDTLLSSHAASVCARVLREEGQQRKHLVVSLSGAHAYGFPSPDSDLDLKAIHIESTHRLLGMSPPVAHADRLEVIDGVEIDYTSNELQPVLRGILQGNGNYIERVLGKLAPEHSPELESLKPIVKRSLSRNVYKHYAGFASGQRAAFAQAEKATAKQVLYVLRTALTGAHLLNTGEMIIDLTELLERYRYAHAWELVEAKKAGERTTLSEIQKAFWSTEVARAFTELDAALARSPLPETAPNADEVEAWLLGLRRQYFSSSA